MTCGASLQGWPSAFHRAYMTYLLRLPALSTAGMLNLLLVPVQYGRLS